MPSNKLVMTLLVRDEVDIVADNIEFHLAAGVDSVVAVDNGSVDGTRDILEEYRRMGVAKVIDEPGRDYSQDLWVTRAALAARDELGADWILNNDSDEFWSAPGNDLKAVLSDDTVDILDCARRNMFCAYDSLATAQWRHVMHFRAASPLERPTLSDSMSDPLPAPYFYLNLPSKLLLRAEGLRKVAMGNHAASRDGQSRVAQAPVTIFHFPIRGRDHLERKVRQGGAAFAANTRLPPSAGWHWRRWYRMLEREGLDTVLADAFPDAARLSADLATGVATEDRDAMKLLAGLTQGRR